MILVDWWGQRNQLDSISDLQVFQPTTQVRMVNGGIIPLPIPSNAYTSERFSWWFALPGFQADDYQFGRIRFEARYYQGWYQNDSVYRVAAGDTAFFPDTQKTLTYQDLQTVQQTTVPLPQTKPNFHVFATAATYRGPKLYKATRSSSTDLLNMRRLDPSGSVNSVAQPGAVDNCLASVPGDTAWIRWGTPANPPGLALRESDLQCYDHNPFFPSRKVEVFSPWTGARPYAVVNGIPQPLRPSARPGWYQGDAWTLPGDSAVLIRFRFDRSNGDSNHVDSASGPYHPIAGAANNYILPAMGTHPGFHRDVLSDSLVFAWTNPWKSRIANLHFGGDERIQGIWQPEGWFAAKIFGRPTKAGLVSSEGDSSIAAVDIPKGTPGTLDTIWLNAKPTVAAKIRMEGSAYDFRLGNAKLVTGRSMTAPLDSSAYFPFSQSTNSDLIAGLVKKRLGPGGLPVWTKKSLCGISAPKDSSLCFHEANAVEKWFAPVSQNGKEMNAKFPVAIELSTVQNGSLTYQDSLFFPLDTFFRIPGTNSPNPFYDSLLGRDFKKHNFGYCIELHGDAQMGPGARLTVASDDDTWIFVDSMLVVDMGGQHGMFTTIVQLDRLPISPLPPLVALDIFHCERHVDESGLVLSMNFPVHAVGAVKTTPRLVTLGPRGPASSTLSLRSRSQALSVFAPAGQAWSLELRSLDGRLLKAVSGTGATLVPWTFSGISVARLRSGGETVTERFAPVR